ncbi:MAG TPA: ABC transporter ATP-binding protein [Stellaceae bacterium]|nr:ABC transporter ATP-binding protein [Stellaceae bacterium]
MLELAGLCTFYDLKQALFGMELAIAAGEVVTLMGRNGAGKTTTVHSIMGFTPARRGRILFEGRDITHRLPHQIARAGIGLVPEGRQIFPNLTVLENLVATAANRRALDTPWTAPRIFELFPRLAERRAHMGRQLSGGEQQMLAIGRALMTNPKLLILDEATEGIAPLVREEIWRCLAALRADGLSLLVIDKNLDALTALADRHYIVQKGKVVWHGSSAELRADPSICIEYLGV